MRYRLQRHDGTDCSATMVPFTVLRMVPIQRYRQVKAHIRVTVPVLDAHNSVANHCHARPVTEKFLECRLGFELFHLDELVVKVEVVQPPSLSCPVAIKQLNINSLSLPAVLKAYCLPASEA